MKVTSIMNNRMRPAGNIAGNYRIKNFFLTAIFFFVGNLFYITVFSQGHPATDDEFVGPFPSWINIKTQYGAVGDGVTDETAAIQAALTAIGNAGSTASVIYLPAGTYRITATLTSSNKANISFIGADPATTKILWGGAASGTMLRLNGVAYSRFNRIKFDGAGSAAIAVDQSWDGTMAYFDTGNEYADDEFIGVGIGIRGGQLGYGFAETAIMRCRFTGNTTAGITLGNFNALDVWVWHSVFENCSVGITNNNTGIFNGTGAGNFKVYNSIFRGSTNSDIIIGNTGEFSFRDNTSTNSTTFLKATAKPYPCHITLQSNTIIDPVSSKAIEILDHGPVMLLDNIIRSRAGATAPVVNIAAYPNSDFLSMGNTFTVANAITSSARNIIYDNAVVTAASLSGLSEQTLPGTQPNLNRTVFEVPPGSTAAAIQVIIDQAALLTGNRPVVHFPYGTYNINSTLNIPPGADMQITGDGDGDVYSTWLNWTGGSSGPVINITGPSKATFRDISINGNNLVSDILMTSIDQSGGKIFMHELEGNTNSDGLLVNGLDYSVVTAYNSRFSQTAGKALRVVGGPLAAMGTPQQAKTIMYGGLEWDNALSHEVSNGGNLMVRDVWYESSNNGPYLNISGKGNFTSDCSSDASPRGTASPQISLSGLNGKVSLVNSYFQDRVAISGNGSQTKFLGMGTTFGDNTLPLGPATNTYIDNTTSPAGDIRSFNSRSYTNPNLISPIRYGSFPVNNIGTVDSTFIAGMLATLRTVHAQVLSSTASGITDLRFYRVWLYKGIKGIHIEGNGTALPVRFVSANTECRNGNVTISWTVQENNLKKFQIEKNEQGFWKVIKTISAEGMGYLDKNYTYQDTSAGSGSFYRIVAFDGNGQNIMSNVLRSSCVLTANSLHVYPNPVKGSTVISIDSKLPSAIELMLYDSRGALVKRSNATLVAGVNQLTYDISGFANGTYTLKAKWAGSEKVAALVKTD